MLRRERRENARVKARTARAKLELFSRPAIDPDLGRQVSRHEDFLDAWKSMRGTDNYQRLRFPIKFTRIPLDDKDARRKARNARKRRAQR